MIKGFKSYLLLLVLSLITIISIIFYFTFPSEQKILLENALQLSNKNRQELEKVLEHYKQDEEKRNAAEFLIRNMLGHFSYAGDEVDSLKAALAQYDPNEGYDEERFGYLKNFPYHKLKKVYDIDNRGYMESWETIKITASVKAAGFVEHMCRIFTIGSEAKVGGYIRIPYCETSPINCCIKTHVDKPVQYL